MPSRSRYTKVKRSAKRGYATFKKGLSVAQTAITAYRTAKQLQAIVNVEKKMFNVLQPLTSISNAGTIISLVNPSQGAGVNNRVGNSIKLKSLQIRCELQPAIGTPTNERIRVMLVKDLRRGYESATNTFINPTLSDILLDTSNPIPSPWTQENMGRFTIMYDKVIQVDVDDWPKRMLTIYKKMNHHLRFPLDGSNQATYGGLYLVFVSEQATLASQPGFLLYSTARYVDN